MQNDGRLTILKSQDEAAYTHLDANEYNHHVYTTRNLTVSNLL